MKKTTNEKSFFDLYDEMLKNKRTWSLEKMIETFKKCVEFFIAANSKDIIHGSLVHFSFVIWDIWGVDVWFDNDGSLVYNAE